GMTGEQQFFLSYAQSWRTKIREALARQRLLVDGHAPADYRADIVRNLDAWYEAFDVKPGQKLYLSPEKRGRLWWRAAMRTLALASPAACSWGPSGVFPSGFLWGSATAAHQVESAAPPATDWAAWEATPGKIANGDRAGAGPDAWDRYDADFAL